VRKLEVEGGDLDFTIYTQFYHCLCEYYIAVGELAQARQQAERLYNYTVSAPDRNHLALAHGLFARIAMAKGDFAEADLQLQRSIATLGNDDFPLAAWRVYLSAAEFYRSVGDASRAGEYRTRYETVIQTLAANFDHGDALRVSLLAGLAGNAAVVEWMAMFDQAASSRLNAIAVRREMSRPVTYPVADLAGRLIH